VRPLWIAAMVCGVLLLLAAGLSAVVGYKEGPWILHPGRRPLLAGSIAEADDAFRGAGATSEDFEVRAPDGALLHGWIVRPARTIEAMGSAQTGEAVRSAQGGGD
jgi:hypothetical protein